MGGLDMEKEILKLRIAETIKSFRTASGWSQEFMGENLRITVRAYGDLERGKYCCSSITLLFLLYLLGADNCWSLVESVCAEILRAEQQGRIAANN